MTLIIRRGQTDDTQWVKEEYIWNSGDPTGHFRVFNCLILMGSGKVQQARP